MKIRNTILSASAILVLAATGATSAMSMIPRDPANHGGSRAVQKSGPSATTNGRRSSSNTTLLARNKALQTANKALVARNKALAAENQALAAENSALWARIHATDPKPDPGTVDTCSTSMVDCTVEQECEIWGYNCDLVVYPPVESTQSESSNEGSEGGG